MFAYVKGTLAEKEPGRAVVEAAGLGYEVLIPLSTYDRLPRTGEETKLLLHHAVREDDEALFGFATEAEREMFRLLLSVSGVGPKMALAIVSASSVGELSLAIAAGNSKRLAAVKGVGKKTAEKICIELKDKVDTIGALAASSRRGENPAAGIARDAIMALTALGFTEETANAKVAAVLEDLPEGADVQTVVTRALAH